jgi:hypothetical protein
VQDNGARFNIDVTDTAVMRLGSSANMENVLDLVLPHPAGFRQVWSQQRGRRQFFAWQPIPPSQDFVALGMVGSNSAEQPSVTCVRCVPLKWCIPTEVKPFKIWDDSGSATGGRRGSVWAVNSMHLIWITPGHDPPPGPFYELFNDQFTITPDMVSKNL